MSRTVFAVGFELPDVPGFETMSFRSNNSLLEADVIAIEPTLCDFTCYGHYNGVSKLQEHDSFEWRRLQPSWLQRLNSALDAGKTVIIFLRDREERYYYTGQTANQGTPGRPRMTNIVASCSNHDLLPIHLSDIQYGRGTSMVLSSGADVISAYWKEFGPFSAYNFFFDGSKGKPLVLTRSGRNTTGALFATRGNLLILPEIDWTPIDVDSDEEEDAEGWSKEIVAFTCRLRDALLEIDAQLRKDSEKTAPPEWAGSAHYRLRAEANLERQIVEVEATIGQLATERDELRRRLDDEAGLRRLLYEGGHQLEEAVRDALTTLGFETDKFKEGGSEFDALFTGPEGRFLGEVEGKENKPVNVDKVSQLHRNVAEDLAREEVEDHAIPVLFGNAFRLQPLSERGAYFTDKVTKFAATAGIALVRTPDLFLVARSVKDTGDLVLARQCRKAIRDGIGGVVQFPEIAPEPSQLAEDGLAES